MHVICACMCVYVHAVYVMSRSYFDVPNNIYFFMRAAFARCLFYGVVWCSAVGRQVSAVSLH